MTDRQYRNRWAHDNLELADTNQFLDEILRDRVVRFTRSLLEFETTLTEQLVEIRTKIETEQGRHVASSPEWMGSNTDLDQRIYSAVVKAMIELRKEEGNTSEGSLTITPSFPVPSKQPQYLSDVFVIMPFADEFRAVFTDVIQPVCNELQLRVKRGDDFFSNDHIIFEVWSAIANSSLIVADCTGKNANVFYELGIAHTLGKPVIVITQDIGDLPFDIMGRRAIKYVNTLAGARGLIDELKNKTPAILNAFNSQNPEPEERL